MSEIPEPADYGRSDKEIPDKLMTDREGGASLQEHVIGEVGTNTGGDKAVVTPQKKHPKEGEKKAVGSAMRCTVASATIECHKCKQKFRACELEKYFRCKNEDCNVYTLDYFRDDLMQDNDIIFGVPENTEKQDRAFDEVQLQLAKVQSLLDNKEKEMNGTIIAMLWDLKAIGVDGDLLFDDSFKKKWPDNKGFVDSLSNCVIASERRDKVGFRNSLYSLMYMVVTGYSHIDWKKGKSEEGMKGKKRKEGK